MIRSIFSKIVELVVGLCKISCLKGYLVLEIYNRYPLKGNGDIFIHSFFIDLSLIKIEAKLLLTALLMKKVRFK